MTSIDSARFAAIAVARRFPIPLALSFLYTTLTLTHWHPELLWPTAAAFAWSAAAGMYIEGRNRRALWHPAIPALIAVSILVVVNGSDTAKVAALGGFIAILAASKPLAWQILVSSCTAVLAGLLALGTVGALLGVINSLLEIPTSQATYPASQIFSGLFVPWLAMALWPQHESQARQVPSWLTVMHAYLLAPTAIVFLIVLNAYCVRLAILHRLPDEALPYPMAGILVWSGLAWALSRPDDAPLSVRLIARLFWPGLIFPATALLTVILNSIPGAGWSLSGYYFALGSAITLVLVLTFLVRSSLPRPQISASLISLALLFSSFGPWGAEAVVIDSQVQRLRGVLDRFHSDPATVSTDEIADFRKTLTFLIVSGADDQIEQALGVPVPVNQPPHQKSLAVLDSLKMRHLGPFSIKPPYPAMVSVPGFDRLHWATFSLHGTRTDQKTLGNGDLALSARLENDGRLYIGGMQDAVDLGTAARRWREAQDPTVPLVIDQTDGARKLRILVHGISGKTGGDGHVHVTDASLTILTKP